MQVGRLIKITILWIGLLSFGTFGFMFLEGWPLFDGVYMTLITLSTVGYGETHELSHAGRMFTSLLIVVSMFGMAICTAGITSLVVKGDLTDSFRKRKEAKMISRLKDHTIVCGDGLVARTLVEQLVRQQKPVVLITDTGDEIRWVRQRYPKLPIVECNPTDETALLDANILQAGIVVAALQSDVNNLMITISCKGLGTGVKVYCCAQTGEFALRMSKVGADHVICPFELGGLQLASLINS